MAKLIAKKLPASTLVEVLISMVIMTIVFSIAMGIYVNITKAGFSLTGQQIQQEIRKIIAESKEDADLADNTVMIDSIIYKKTVSPYMSYADLLTIQVSAEMNGKILGSGREVIRRPNELPDSYRENQ